MQNFSCYTRHAIVQKLSNKQSAKVIFKFDRLRTSHNKRKKSLMSIEKVIVCPWFDYTVLRVNPDLTSGKEVTTALLFTTYKPYTLCVSTKVICRFDRLPIVKTLLQPCYLQHTHTNTRYLKCYTLCVRHMHLTYRIKISGWQIFLTGDMHTGKGSVSITKA